MDFPDQSPIDFSELIKTQGMFGSTFFKDYEQPKPVEKKEEFDMNDAVTMDAILTPKYKVVIKRKK